MWDCEYAASKRDGLCASATHSQTIWAGSIWKIIPSLIMEAWNENILIPQIFEYFHIFIRLAWGCGSQRLDQQIVFVRFCEWLEAHNTVCLCETARNIRIDGQTFMYVEFMNDIHGTFKSKRKKSVVGFLAYVIFLLRVDQLDRCFLHDSVQHSVCLPVGLLLCVLPGLCEYDACARVLRPIDNFGIELYSTTDSFHTSHSLCVLPFNDGTKCILDCRHRHIIMVYCELFATIWIDANVYFCVCVWCCATASNNSNDDAAADNEVNDERMQRVEKIAKEYGNNIGECEPDELLKYGYAFILECECELQQNTFSYIHEHCMNSLRAQIIYTYNIYMLCIAF